jgi:transcriptional regulator
VVNNQVRGIAILEEMIMQSEPAYKQQWDTLPESYKMGLYNSIVPVEIAVTELKAVNKLSQDKAAHEREKIAHTLATNEDSTARDIAEYMEKMNATNIG